MRATPSDPLDEVSAAVEESLRRVLHDDVKPALTAIMDYGGLVPQLCRSAAASAVRSIEALGAECRVSRDPANNAAGRAVSEVVTKTVDRLSAYLSGTPVRYEGSPYVAGRPPEYQEPILTVAQADAVGRALAETLRNTARHAGGARVRIRTGVGAEWAWLRVIDDGRGFCGRPNGFGYRHSVTGAMAAIGGVVRLRSKPGCGTLVDLSWPTAVPSTAARGRPTECERERAHRIALRRHPVRLMLARRIAPWLTAVATGRIDVAHPDAATVARTLLGEVMDEIALPGHVDPMLRAKMAAARDSGTVIALALGLPAGRTANLAVRVLDRVLDGTPPKRVDIRYDDSQAQLMVRVCPPPRSGERFAVHIELGETAYRVAEDVGGMTITVPRAGRPGAQALGTRRTADLLVAS
ncbi:MAG: hypothetical protein CSA58_11705 [Micrococcales bacterium]|nr:MAG: hypothetical protein CSB46_05240 [Micrococcales bacterium]PIE26001.1 MAG: hypothetical protein CSA58_11705 [Micrococcales bacterium]